MAGIKSLHVDGGVCVGVQSFERDNGALLSIGGINRSAIASLSEQDRRDIAAALLEGLPAGPPAFDGGVLTKEQTDEFIAALKAGKTVSFKMTTEARS